MEDGPFKVILDNIEDLRLLVIRSGIPLLFFFVIFLMFEAREITIFGKNIPLIYPDPYDNMGAQFLKVLISHVITENFQLLAIKPTDGVVADFYACLFLSVLVTSPNFYFQLSRFIGPALKTNEKEMLRVTLIPALALFLIGAFIGIYFVAPLVFKILYQFDIGVGAQPTMSITSFVSFFLIYVIAFGLSFETAVIIVGLTSMGVVNAKYWQDNWRYAVVAALIFGVIFSPGVTGVTMMLLAIPIIILYFVGISASRRVQKKKDLRDALERKDSKI